MYTYLYIYIYIYSYIFIISHESPCFYGSNINNGPRLRHGVVHASASVASVAASDGPKDAVQLAAELRQLLAVEKSPGVFCVFFR